MWYLLFKQSASFDERDKTGSFWRSDISSTEKITQISHCRIHWHFDKYSIRRTWYHIILMYTYWQSRVKYILSNYCWDWRKIDVFYLSRSQASVRSSLALLLRASSGRPAGCLIVISSRGRCANSASRSPELETRRASAAPRLFRRKIFRRPRRGWKRRFFGSASRRHSQRKIT